MGLFDGSGNTFQFSDYNTNMSTDHSGDVEGAGSDMFGGLYNQDNPEDFGMGGSANIFPELPAELELYKNSAEQVASVFIKIKLTLSINIINEHQ